MNRNKINRIRRLELIRAATGTVRYDISGVPYGVPLEQHEASRKPMTVAEWEAKHCHRSKGKGADSSGAA